MPSGVPVASYRFAVWPLMDRALPAAGLWAATGLSQPPSVHRAVGRFLGQALAERMRAAAGCPGNDHDGDHDDRHDADHDTNVSTGTAADFGPSAEADAPLPPRTSTPLPLPLRMFADLEATAGSCPNKYALQLTTL